MLFSLNILLLPTWADRGFSPSLAPDKLRRWLSSTANAVSKYRGITVFPVAVFLNCALCISLYSGRPTIVVLCRLSAASCFFKAEKLLFRTKKILLLAVSFCCSDQLVGSDKFARLAFCDDQPRSTDYSYLTYGSHSFCKLHAIILERRG